MTNLAEGNVKEHFEFTGRILKRTGEPDWTYNCNYLFNSRMARMKNTKRNQPGPRYPLAEYQKLTGNKSIDTNLYKTNNEFIKQLLHELIDNIIKLSEIKMHEKTISNTENQNVELLNEDANKENELTTPMHDNDKSTNCEIRIQNILKEAQENRKILVKDIQKPIIYSETVASTSHPTQIKGGKPSSFYGSYYAKINNENLRSMKRGKGIGTKKIKINSSHSQVERTKSEDSEVGTRSEGKHFINKLPTPKTRDGKRYTTEGRKAPVASIKAQKDIIKSKQSTGALKRPHKY